MLNPKELHLSCKLPLFLPMPCLEPLGLRKPQIAFRPLEQMAGWTFVGCQTHW